MDGHYFAYIRTDTGWLKFDDNEVSEVSEVKVLNNKNAYILFYERM
jgi:ubiquitin C-terminal hydrolase